MIAPIGHFKVWRELFTKPIWTKSTPEQKAILFTLLSMANFKENEWEWNGEKFKVEKGQFVTSLESIKLACGKGISTQNVRSALIRFEKLGFLTNKSTKQGRLITIMNWALYQPEKKQGNNATDKEVTKNQQRGNKELTPKGEGNKGKESNKVNKKENKKEPSKTAFGDFVKLTDTEYENLCKDYGKKIIDNKIEDMNNYIGAKGKRYKSHNHALRSWLKKDTKKEEPKKQEFRYSIDVTDPKNQT